MEITIILLASIILISLLKVWRMNSRKGLKLPPTFDGTLPLLGIAHQFFGDSQRKYISNY